MSVLTIKNLESHHQDTCLFPEFNLSVDKGQVVAIYSSLNVRHMLLAMLTGKRATGYGQIWVNGVQVHDHTAYHHEIGLLFFDDGLYDRLTVKDHLTFYKRLYNSDEVIDTVLSLTRLEALKHVKVKQLSFSEQRRIHFARLQFQMPALYVFEEPDLNVDTETRHVFFNVIERLQQADKSMLILTGNMENAITVANMVYQLDEQGLQPIDIGAEASDDKEEGVEKQTIHFDKIPTKVNDKIILFDPPEIDYIESRDGQSHLHIKGEAFLCVFTLADLEARLSAFGFFRCHRSYIVNLQKVREVITWTRNSFNLTLDDNNKSSIPLSKAKMGELKTMLGLK